MAKKIRRWFRARDAKEWLLVVQKYMLMKLNVANNLAQKKWRAQGGGRKRINGDIDLYQAIYSDTPNMKFFFN